MKRLPDVGRLGGYSRAVLRHLERRGPQTREQLDDHFVFEAGSHGWHVESLDGAIGELLATGRISEPGEDERFRLTLRSPL